MNTLPCREDSLNSQGSLSARPCANTLETVLRHPAIWRGRDCAPEPAALPTGFAALDRLLPGQGWPQGALTELVLAREGIGEIRLTLPALAALQARGRDIVWVDPPYRPYAPALAAAGLDLSRLLIVRCRDRRDALWAYEQALRAPECGAAFAWMPVHDERVLRRLQVAAREGATWGVLWRRPGEHGYAAAAPLRLGLAPREGRLAVHVLKRRGGEILHPALLDVDARWIPAIAGPDYRSLCTERFAIPRRPMPRPDPRTTAGDTRMFPLRHTVARH